MPQYVALLRGINVGGNNLIKMAALKSCFEEQGFENVATYINSGNVLFETSEEGSARLASRIEGALADGLGYQSWVALCSHPQLKSIVEDAPPGFGSDPGTFCYNVLFLRESTSAPTALTEVKTREGVDQAWAANGVLYFSYLISRASQSYISRLIGTAIYQSMTIRNWNTTTKLLALMADRDSTSSPRAPTAAGSPRPRAAANRRGGRA